MSKLDDYKRNFEKEEDLRKESLRISEQIRRDRSAKITAIIAATAATIAAIGAIWLAWKSH